MNRPRPVATYRVQLSRAFTFRDLYQIIPYLDQMGISTVYASPIFKAASGSTHGYDVTDPHQLNPEIGTWADWSKVRQEMNKRNMTWLQDIVPNHMAFDTANEWLQDVFQWGPDSKYYDFFDIDWDYPDKEWKGKVIVPFLGSPRAEALQDQQIQVVKDGGRFSLKYYEHQFALSMRSLPLLLEGIVKDQGDDFREIENLLSAIDDTDGRDKTHHKIGQEISKMVSDPEFSPLLHKALLKINSDISLLENLLELQYFWLVPWQITNHKINYRRFFTINSLIGIRQEDLDVFHEYHRFIVELCRTGWIDGLRIDHVDGLYNPTAYLQRLRNAVGPTYIVVEKILAWGESLPRIWPVDGTTGYDFLPVVNQLFTNKESEAYFTKEYQTRTGRDVEFDDLAFEKKRWILENRMAGEFNNLFRFIKDYNLLPEELLQVTAKWEETLKVFLCSFPLYRLYPASFPLSGRTDGRLKLIHQRAVKRAPDLTREIKALYLLFQGQAEIPKGIQLDFFLRSQQLTGSLAAKGIEDTSFYVYLRLISHNEVGDDPSWFGLTARAFHDRMQRWQEDFPFTINATASHDTKRGEDARMRINSLTYIPDEWFDHVRSWMRINNSHKHDGIPDANLEYFIYQTLIGAWPVETTSDAEFMSRTSAYLQKVLRESKEYSNWANPRESLEEDVIDFIGVMLQDKKFMASFLPFAEKVTRYGAVSSLGQTVLKVTSPGVPDIYQGTELWDLSYVDPDNRRPVDYEKRKRYASELENMTSMERTALWADISSEKMKMYILCDVLRFRRAHPKLFSEGEYIPVYVKDESTSGVLAFCRNLPEHWMLTVVTTDPGLAMAAQSKSRGYGVNSVLQLPDKAPDQWTDIFTGLSYLGKDKLDLRSLLTTLPVAVLTNMNYGA